MGEVVLSETGGTRDESSGCLLCFWFTIIYLTIYNLINHLVIHKK